MESGVGYQLLGHRVDSFIYCNSKDCTSCNVSCAVRFCLTSVSVCVWVCSSFQHTSSNAQLLLLWEEQLFWKCSRGRGSLHSFCMANILSPGRPLTAKSCSSSEESQEYGFNAVRFAVVREHNMTRAQRKWITARKQTQTHCKQKSRTVKKKKSYRDEGYNVLERCWFNFMMILEAAVCAAVELWQVPLLLSPPHSYQWV